MNLVWINLFYYTLEKNFYGVNNLTKKYVKTSFVGAANKGNCFIYFNYYSSSISIGYINLTGEKKNKQRLKEIFEVQNVKISSFIKPDEKNILINENDINQENRNDTFKLNNEMNENIYTFKESDIWIFFGDLNFRIDY